MGNSELLSSWVSKPSDSDRDPHGNLAKVDKEDVATCHLVTKQRNDKSLEDKVVQKLNGP